jgi:hypothetical protein
MAEAAKAMLSAPAETESERISIWKDAYLKLGVDPNKYSPSIKFLCDQVLRGRPPRSIDKIVDIMAVYPDPHNQEVDERFESHFAVGGYKPGKIRKKLAERAEWVIAPSKPKP